MDKKRALLNILFSTVLRVILIVLHLFVIKSLDLMEGGNITGYNSLFNSIISVLSLAECGFSGGVAFCLYGAITSNNQKKVAGLYNFIKKTYRIIFIIFMSLGLAITPLLPFLNMQTGGSYASVPVEVYFAFIMYIASSALSYLYAYKGVIIAAYKNNYKKDFAASGGLIIGYSLMIILALTTNNFLIASSALLVGSLVSYLLYFLIFRKDHHELETANDLLSKEERKEISKYVVSVFVHIVGDVIIYSTDSIIISSFLGADVLGDFYHYQSIINAIFSVITLAFTSLTSIIGHYISLKKDSDKQERLCKYYYFFNFAVGSIVLLGFYGASEAFISWVYGSSMNILWYVLAALTFCYFTRFMQRTMQTLRDAGGTFSKDFYRPIIESIVNIALDIILVQYLGVFGVILATIVVNIFISHVIEPIIGFKYVIHKNPLWYYLTNYGCHILFVGEMTAVYFIKEGFESIFNNPIILFFILGAISVMIAAIIVIPNLLIMIKKLRKGRALSYNTNRAD